jgi:ankyrin repeat protein
MVELLLSKGANVNTQSESGKTALMLAAFAGKINIIKELRNNDARLDLKDRLTHYLVIFDYWIFMISKTSKHLVPDYRCFITPSTEAIWTR